MVKASLPFLPKRCGPIWSVVVQGAIVSRPLLRNSCVAAAPYSTSQVSIAIFAPCWMSCAAHDFCRLSWWLQILIWKFGPPLFASFAASIWAPASAGESNGFMLLVRSTAAPITIVFPFAVLLPEAVVAAAVTVDAATKTPSTAMIQRLGFFILPSLEKVSAIVTLRAFLGAINVVGLASRDAPVDLRVHDADSDLRGGPRRLRCRGRRRHRRLRVQAHRPLRTAAAGQRPRGDALHSVGAVDPAAAADGRAGRPGAAGRGTVRECAAARGAGTRLRRLPHRPRPRAGRRSRRHPRRCRGWAGDRRARGPRARPCLAGRGVLVRAHDSGRARADRVGAR